VASPPDRRADPEEKSMADHARPSGTRNDDDVTTADRRSGDDRRSLAPVSETNLERRRGPGRRLSDFVRAAEEGEMNREQFLFLVAIEEFKRVNGKAFPNWTDVLEVIRKLGYRKTLRSSVDLRGRAEDFTERPDAPAGVERPAAAAA
jgi:hypothetical protein